MPEYSQLGRLVGLMTDFMNRLEKLVDVVKPSTTVFLGRDADLLAPVWKLRGHPAQVFHWARITEWNNVIGRWKKEVPPNALVVDTGFSGTIPAMIYVLDPWFGGAVLITAKEEDDEGERYFSSLFGDCDRETREAIREVVLGFEALPKVHARVHDYAGRLAVPLNPEDDRDSAPVDPVRAVVIRRMILSELVGPEEARRHEDASVYLTMEGRVGLGDPVPEDYEERNLALRAQAERDYQELLNSDPLVLAEKLGLSLLDILRRVPLSKRKTYWEENLRWAAYRALPKDEWDRVSLFMGYCDLIVGAMVE